MQMSKMIDEICYQLEDQDKRVELAKSIETDEELYALLGHYNWDDGFEIPTVIADHPKCDLAIAIKLYWLAEADYWHNSDREVDEFNRAHYEFSKLITERILSGHYRPGRLAHSEDFNRVQIYKFKKQGLPEILYSPVVGPST